MRAVRANAIEIGRESLGAEKEDSERGWAVVLGTLGRQGSLNVLKSITTGIATRVGGKKMVIPILLSELSAGKLGLLSDWIDVCVQTSCPRLSIDWGHDFLVDGVGRVVPLLNPYEAKVALGQAQAFQSRPTVRASESPLLDTYPMDFLRRRVAGRLDPAPRPKPASRTPARRGPAARHMMSHARETLSRLRARLFSASFRATQGCSPAPSIHTHNYIYMPLCGQENHATA